MDLQLQNKIVLVSGGAKGIGAAIVGSFAAEGAIPVILDRNPQEAQALLDDIACGHFFHVELTDTIQIRKTIDQIHEQVGEVDVLVNNAGVNDGASLEKGPQAFVSSLEKTSYTHSPLPTTSSMTSRITAEISSMLVQRWLIPGREAHQGMPHPREQ